jgi:hypothetical protein
MAIGSGAQLSHSNSALAPVGALAVRLAIKAKSAAISVVTYTQEVRAGNTRGVSRTHRCQVHERNKEIITYYVIGEGVFECRKASAG